ncbi:MAG: hypothetical protein PSX80_11415 [bacterium]|nr:hypothetical protein [bacterium]
MKITRTMTINEVLKVDEEKMLKTLTWLVPALERLQQPHPRRAIVGAVTIEQAARIARIPLNEFLYALNLAAGESEEILAKELSDNFK